MNQKEIEAQLQPGIRPDDAAVLREQRFPAAGVRKGHKFTQVA
jgi:hypothetical protein